MNIKFLDTNHYLFGGKGDVWNETAHIAKKGYSTTLCGKPMLSSNHVAINNVQDAGCIECVNEFNKKIMKKNDEFEFGKQRPKKISVNDKFENNIKELAMLLDKETAKNTALEFDAISGDIMKKLYEMIPSGARPTLIVRFGTVSAIISGEDSLEQIGMVVSDVLKNLGGKNAQRRKIDED